MTISGHAALRIGKFDGTDCVYLGGLVDDVFYPLAIIVNHQQHRGKVEVWGASEQMPIKFLKTDDGFVDERGNEV